MSFAETLRHAEEQGKAAVHHGAEKVHQIESAIRRKLKKSAPASVPPAAPEQERENSASAQGRTGIVSVNGRDVEQMRCTGGRRSV